MSRSSIVRTAVTFAAAAALAGAPAASARPADQGAQLPATIPQLTLAQLKAVDGHQPPAPIVTYVAPTSLAPAQQAGPGGGTSPVPWIAGGVAALLFAAFGLARFTGVRPTRRRQPAA
ncbi:MAG TPA: hypothetical protein VFT42_07545 [Solirubrobacteraceae bacterium]|nr:hypothetical protein [Solirubrobacteraceae bacterium]